MCHFTTVSYLGGCLHTFVDTKECGRKSTRTFLQATPGCTTTSNNQRLHGKCRECKESEQAQAARPQRSEKREKFAQAPELFAWPESAKTQERPQPLARLSRNSVKDIPVNRLPENQNTVRQESIRKSGVLEKPLPKLPGTARTHPDFLARAREQEALRVSRLTTRPTARLPMVSHLDQRLKTKDRLVRYEREASRVHAATPQAPVRRRPLSKEAAARIEQDAKRKAEAQPLANRDAELFFPKSAKHKQLSVPDAARHREAAAAWKNTQRAWDSHRPLIHSESKELFLPRSAKDQQAERRKKAAEVWATMQKAWDHRPLTHSESKQLFLPKSAEELAAQRRQEATAAWNRTQKAWDRPLVHSQNMELFLSPIPRTTHSIRWMESISEISISSPIEFESATSATPRKFSTLPIDLAPPHGNTPQETNTTGQMSGRISTVGLWNSYDAPKTLQVISKPPTKMAHELPTLKRLSGMQFDGTILESEVGLQACDGEGSS
ncbi:hypothetical protein JHW43_004932 [Diplocarpon mali]|nr:hypothetical protein JHW43_004932 [Diplocarpon mali]